MKDKYEIPIPGTNKKAIAKLFNDWLFKCRWICGIDVPLSHRGQGYGSKVLKAVLEDADVEKVELRLYVWPMHNPTLSMRELMAWYRRHGFTWIGKETYRRKPHAI